jgi:N-acetylmuramoyl-L-alanine amidase
VRLFKQGNSGREVRDIQGRLVSAGFLDKECEEIAGELFGPATDSALRAFQQQRGLIADGIVGPETWRSLVEASRALGNRFLYLREPPFRGDDVGELQRRLNALGFYSGKEDGIFNDDAMLAVEQFQRNLGMPTDGIVGTKTVEALLRLSRVTRPSSVASVRETEKGLPTGGIHGRRIMVDPGHGFPPDPGQVGPSGLKESEVAERVSARLEKILAERHLAVVFLSRRPGESISDKARAARANEQGVELVLSIHLNASRDPKAGGSSSFYFERGHYRSPYGYRLANHIQDELVARLDAPDCRAHGAALPLLRETRMPVVIVEPAFITNPEEEKLLAGDPFVEKIAVAVAEAARKYFEGIKPTAEFEK